MHRVRVDGFWMDRTEVTIQTFAAFIGATGHTTVAKRISGSWLRSLSAPQDPVPLNNSLQWWRWVSGADWLHPEGPESSIENRVDHRLPSKKPKPSVPGKRDP